MLANSTFSEKEISLISGIMKDNVGIDLSGFKMPFISRRINARMQLKGIREGSEYARLLEEDPLEPLNLYNSLSINVTKCFRDPNVWETFRANVLPSMIQNSSTSETIRVWSAGCATGQEPYSLAIMLNEAIGTKKIHFKITSTDMNRVSISIAETGKYDPKSLNNIPTELFPKYFQKLDDELYQVRDILKQNIDFVVGDVSSIDIGSMDLIVCRNLLIYYSRDAQELLFKKFHNSLKKDGYLILGMDESMIGTIGTSLFLPLYPRERIYIKAKEESS